MSDFATKMKTMLQCSARLIGKTTKAAAQSTKYKLNEMSAMSKRRELISDLGERVYALSQQGTSVPEELKDMIAQINALDTNLDALRADHAARKAAAAEKAAAEKAERAARKLQRKQRRLLPRRANQFRSLNRLLKTVMRPLHRFWMSAATQPVKPVRTTTTFPL